MESVITHRQVRGEAIDVSYRHMPLQAGETTWAVTPTARREVSMCATPLGSIAPVRVQGVVGHRGS
jgi:hypothetical protein